MDKINYLVNWGDFMRDWNDCSSPVLISNYSYNSRINEKSSYKWIKHLYSSLEEETKKESKETESKKYEDLTEAYCDLSIKIKDDYRELTNTENIFIMILLKKHEETVKKRCDYILRERKLIEESNPIEERDYLYYINSLSWFNMKLDNFKESVYVSGKKRKNEIKYKMKDRSDLYSRKFSANIRLK